MTGNIKRCDSRQSFIICSPGFWFIDRSHFTFFLFRVCKHNIFFLLPNVVLFSMAIFFFLSCKKKDNIMSGKIKEITLSNHTNVCWSFKWISGSSFWRHNMSFVGHANVSSNINVMWFLLLMCIIFRTGVFFNPCRKQFKLGVSPH